MPDLVTFAARGISQGSAWVPLVACAAGLASSFGPCVAPRFVAAVGIAADSPPRERYHRLAAFAGGLCGGYVLLVTTIALVARIAAWSSTVDAALAVGFACAAIGAAREPSAHTCVRPLAGSSAKAFMIGISLALIGSPCCAPILIFLAGAAPLTGGAPLVALAAAAFAAGHIAPVVLAGAFAGQLSRRFDRPVLAHARATVVTGLFLGLCAYYGVMA